MTPACTVPTECCMNSWSHFLITINKTILLMKLLFKISMLVAGLILVVGTLAAQQIDQDRMDQDLRISEGILGELLQIRQRGFEIIGGSQINSLYIPGFGVIFDVNPPASFISGRIQTINISGPDDGSGKTSVRIVEKDDESYNTTTITGNNVLISPSSEESTDIMKEAIRNYFTSYADIIAQLPPSESITVMVRRSPSILFRSPPPPPAPPSYGISTSVSGVATTGAASADKGFIMSVHKSDIAAFRAQRISKEEFEKKINESAISDNTNSDFQIFEKILETGLSSANNKSFSLNRELSRIYDDQLGLVILGSIRSASNIAYSSASPALSSWPVGGDPAEAFSSWTTTGDSFPAFDFNVMSFDSTRKFIRIDSLYSNLDTLYFRHNSSMDSLHLKLRRTQEELSKRQVELQRRSNDELRQTATELRRVLVGTAGESRTREEMISDFDAFETEAKSLLLDYGRTLSSLKPDQMVILSLSQRRNIEGVPSRIVLSVKKSTLSAYDRKTITKEAALRQITIKRN